MLKVLIADDDVVASTLVKGLLESWGFQVTVARDGEEAVAILLHPTEAPRIAIVDWSMPGCSGLDVCRRVRLNSERGYTYLIMATARGERKDILEGLSAGADDYLVKPILAAELRARIEIGKRIVNLQEQLLSALASARYQASHDSLTGLWNRSAVIEQLTAVLARCEREGGAVGLLLADIDYFKRLNDTYGHHAGDNVLRHVARLLRCAVRVYDIVGRYGGDEFLIIAPACDLYDITQLGERMCDLIAKSPAELGGRAEKVTISVGAVNVQSCVLGNENRLIDAADAVLYQAKNEGRNRVCVETMRLDKIAGLPPSPAHQEKPV